MTNNLPLLNCLQQRLETLLPWLDQNEIEAYRWYDHQLENYPFSIEVYLNSLHIHHSGSTFTTKDESDLKNFFNKEFSIPEENIFFKTRKKQEGKQQYNSFDQKKKFFTIKENDCLFHINLSDYFDSGLFLDHRDSRQWAAEQAKNKRVLNLFCYTAAFSIYTAKAGARETVSVDTSNTYLKWGQRNLELNQLPLNKNKFVKMDAIKYLSQPVSQTGFFDLIILDPPTFSNSKSRKGIFDIQRDHGALVEQCLKRLSPKGVLLFSTNFTKFKWKVELANITVENVTEDSTPQDFKDSPFQRFCYHIRRKN